MTPAAPLHPPLPVPIPPMDSEPPAGDAPNSSHDSTHRVACRDQKLSQLDIWECKS